MGEFKISWAQYGWFPVTADLAVDASVHGEPQGAENAGQNADVADEVDEE